MPFPTRIISHRSDIADVFSTNPVNPRHVLQKTNVSNLVGLMTQLNHLSVHAHEIFTDILTATEGCSDRIQTVKKRVHNLENTLPKYESLLTANTPSYFYDNPYSGKEYLRNDPLNGLLFTRADASATVNKRRATAMPPADLSPLDRISQNGACIKQFTDSDFFINEWLENERRKRAEEKEKRRLLKANRKKGKVKRKQNKTIKKLHRKRYDDQGNEIKTDNEPTEIAVTQYQLTDTNRNYDVLFKKQKKATRHVVKERVNASKHQSAPSYGVPHVSVFSEISDANNGQKIASKLAVKPPKPPPIPPPIPANAFSKSVSESVSERREKRLRQLSADIPMGDISYDIPENAPSPAAIYATKYQKRDLENEVLDLSKASNIITASPPEIRPIPPKLNVSANVSANAQAPLSFLGDIAAFKKKGKLKHVNRHQSTDKRTNLLLQLKNNKVKLKPAKQQMAPKKQERNLIFEEMNKRRNYMVDSSDSDESDWGSESD